MNYYFELDGPINESSYVAMYGYRDDSLDAQLTLLKIIIHASRVWSEDTSGCVKFIKNKDKRCDVDLKEFFWIKLKCQPL